MDADAVAEAVRARVGDAARVTVNRTRAGWSFGVAVIPAPAIPGHYPHGWLFLAHRAAENRTPEDGASENTAPENTAPAHRAVEEDIAVALEGDAGFPAAAAQATVLADHERAAFAPTESVTGDSNTESSNTESSNTRSSNTESSNTGMRLPFGLGQTWDWGGGPHGWSASPGEPRSSIDLSGGDERVLAARGGVAYSLCTGWTRIVHGDGYASDYYHLRNGVRFDGTPVEEGAYLGDTGTDVTCGGAAYGRHVHFALRYGGAYRSIDGHGVGKWIFSAGPAQYEGTALHGSAEAHDGGRLTNFGALGADEAVVDAYNNMGVNRRSGPGTGHPIVGWVADGETVTVRRSATGDSLTGRRGTTDAWSELADGTWVSNAFLWSGTPPG